MSERKELVDHGWIHPTGMCPDVVHLVCLGESMKRDYTNWMLKKQRPPFSIPTEIWTVNRGVALLQADLAFVLDEVERERRLDPAYAEAMDRFAGPILSTKLEVNRPGHHVYPAPAVLDCCGIPGDPYWHNSVPMIIAYALALGVKELALWGADYTLPDGRTLENDRSNVEFWLGFAKAKGMAIGVPPSTTLMNHANLRGELRVYGLVDASESAAFLKGWPEAAVAEGALS